jgi:hypothetical protein
MAVRELNPKEAEILDLSLEIIAEGHSGADATRWALAALPNPDPEFVTWLAAAN